MYASSVHMKPENAWKGILETNKKKFSNIFPHGLCLLTVSRSAITALRLAVKNNCMVYKLCFLVRAASINSCLFHEAKYLNGVSDQHATNCLIMT